MEINFRGDNTILLPVWQASSTVSGLQRVSISVVVFPFKTEDPFAEKDFLLNKETLETYTFGSCSIRTGNNISQVLSVQRSVGNDLTPSA